MSRLELQTKMSEWYNSQKKRKSNFRKLLQERIEKTNPRRTFTTEKQRHYLNLRV